MRKGLVLAGIGFGGVTLCGLASEAVAAWLAPLTVVALAAVALVMPSEPDAGAGDGGGADGVANGEGGGDGDAGGDGGE